MGNLPNLKNPPKPPPPRIRVAKKPPPEPVADVLKATEAEIWALERADLQRRAAQAEKQAAMLERALTLQVIDPKGKIRTLEVIAADSEKLLAQAKTAHEAAIESIRSRLGITGEFDLDSDTGVITAGTTPASGKE
jgi:hypothetical protein